MKSKKSIKKELFNNFNFKKITSDGNFKEDSVREVIILPILRKLGYKQQNIIRSKTLQHPFFKIGSNKKIPIRLIPDYCLRIKDSFSLVLDAKSPIKKTDNDDNLQQVYGYAAHPEIRSTYFALCNGLEFVLYKTNNENTPVLQFAVEEIDEYWTVLEKYLSPGSFQTGKSIVYEPIYKNKDFNYAKRPLLKEIEVKKRASRRHFGVHGYFTKQSWNVVAEYIKNFSQKGDLVLDPFGGSGVTAIEAMMNERKGINIDINPLAIFLVNTLVVPVDLQQLAEIFEKIKNEYQKKEPKTKKEIKEALKKYPQPQSLSLPKGSEVPTTDLLFNDRQTAQLGLLKSIILKIKNKNSRDSFLLMFAGMVERTNLTYHTGKKATSTNISGGASGIIRYYRYRIAPTPVFIDMIKYFELRYKKIKAAKKEMEYYINNRTINNLKVIKGTATDLHFIKEESVDYIYTDPPYGKKIPYLDLSAMWHAWLDLEVTERDYELEAIEGGSRNKSKDEYKNLIKRSIKEMYRVLKFDRWLSFVFAHKDPEFWHLIVETCQDCGFEYIGAVPQKNGQTSFRKRQNPFTVLSGQLIINFRKTKDPKYFLKANLGMDIEQILLQTMEGIVAKNDGATLEEINDEIIIRGLELGFLDLLKDKYEDLTPILKEYFDYDEESEKYLLKKGQKFKTLVDVKLRVKYYTLSYLRRMERENKKASFDDIVLYIMPLLKNGITPDNQTILGILESIAERTDDDKWRLKKYGNYGQRKINF